MPSPEPEKDDPAPVEEKDEELSPSRKLANAMASGSGTQIAELGGDKAGELVQLSALARAAELDAFKDVMSSSIGVDGSKIVVIVEYDDKEIVNSTVVLSKKGVVKDIK